MHQLLLDGAAREPDKVALRWIDRAKTLTYAQSVVATEHFAGALDHMGVRAGDRVTSITVQKLSLEDVFIHFTGRTLRDEPAKKVSLFVGAGMPQQR